MLFLHFSQPAKCPGTDMQCNDKTEQLKRWYAGPLGQQVLLESERAVAQRLETAFGYHLMQIGHVPELPLFGSARIHHRIYQTPSAGDGTSLIACGEQMPLGNDSIDVLIVHHALEFSPDPYVLLREVQRVLASQGRLIIVAFNPWSVLGSLRLLQAMRRSEPEHRPNWLSLRRLQDWLRLLGFEVRKMQHIQALPHWGESRLSGWVEQGERLLTQRLGCAGGVFVLEAVKQVAAITPLRARRVRQPLLGLVPKPSQQPSASGGQSARAAGTNQE